MLAVDLWQVAWPLGNSDFLFHEPPALDTFGLS